MKEFDTFLARAQARRAWMEQAATNCRARVRRERQETERLRTRRIFLGAFLTVVSISASLFAIYVAPNIQTKAEQDAARVEELEAENVRLLSELRRLDELAEKENRDGAECEPVMDASDLYVDESAAAIYNAPAWMQAGEFRIYHYCACEECTGKSPGDRGYGITKTGVKARTDRTISVDPDVIPLGSEVEINGKIYVAEDTGVSGRCIDIYVNDHAEALRLGTYTAGVSWR